MNNKETLKKIFAAPYDQESWIRQLRYIFLDEIEIFLQPVSVETDQVEKFLHLGILTTADGKKLGIYETKVTDNTQLARNRVQLRNLVAKHIKAKGLDGALSVYYGKKSLWRFSYIAVEHKFDEQNQLRADETAYKRYTYLLGEGVQTRTAINRFSILQPVPTLAQLSEAFAVETLNQEFYKKLYQWYEYAQNQVTFPNDEGRDKDEHIASSLIRLITRLLFVWFLKEKGLINSDLFDKQEVEQLIDWEKPGGFYKAILQNLFFATLNRGIQDRSFRTTTKGRADSNNYLVTNVYRYQGYFQNKDKNHIIELFAKTPFLNGGLFECLDREATNEEKEAYDLNQSIRKEKYAIRIDGFSDRLDNSINLPNELFFNDSERQPGLINLLGQYQFTVEESAPLDIEVALDPELLGKAFENLLASHNRETQENARKASGSYYTPREIVAYMVDESLKAHLQQSVTPEDGDMKFFGERLNDLFDVADRTGELDSNEGIVIYESEIEPLIEAISEAKIIDPAVGSGAFPMGVLQRMVSLLSVLDPDNEKWEAQQLRQLPDLKSIEQDLKTASNINDQQAREKAEEELQKRRQEIEDLFRKQDQNYLRKLYLIENCIFGVDIQPVAIQIAKLRFFISLVIEQNPDSKADNYGILALPNLETKFIVTNSLIGLNKPKQGVLYSEDVKSKEKQLHQIRMHKYFYAKTLRTKRKYQQLDKEIRTEIARLLETDCWNAVDAQKIADWDPYNQNAIDNWFDPEWMFGVASGFDITIGNPPYVRSELMARTDKLRELREQLTRSGQYETLYEKWDLYIPFIEKGYKLLGDNGFTTMIVSDAYCHAEYAKESQNWFLKNSRILRLDFFSKIQIFEAGVRNITYLFQKAEGSKNKPERRVHNPVFGVVNLLPTDEQRNLTHRAFFPEDTPVPEPSSPTITLSNICYISYGLRPSSKEDAIERFVTADLISTEKDELHCKPFVDGRHLDCWLPKTNIWIEWGTNRSPAQFCRPTFQQMYDVDEKILAQRIPGPNPKSCYDNQHLIFTSSSVGFIPWHSLSGVRNKSIRKSARYCNEKQLRDLPQREKLENISQRFDIKFLLGVMNSEFARNFLRANRRHNLSLYPNDWKNLLIPDVPHEQQAPIVNLVNQILSDKGGNPEANTETQEAEINYLVNQLYGLTETS